MSDHAAPKISTPEYYDRLEALEGAHPWTEAMRQTAFALLERFGSDAPSARLLDAGCGTGLFLKQAESRPPGGMAMGCDASMDGLRRARRRGAVCLAAATVCELPFRGECLDTVTCFDVLQHLRSTQARATIDEFHRVLKNEGVLLIRAAARRGWGRKSHQDTEDYQQWEPDKLRQLLEAGGFHVVFVTLTNFLPAVWADGRGWALEEAPRGDEGLRPRPLSSESFKGRLLRAYWHIERRWILEHGCRPPLGHTVYCVSRKG